MKKLFSILLLLAINHCFAQSNIDLKTLIGKPQKKAVSDLAKWGIKVTASNSFPNLFDAYKGGIQVGITSGRVNTIWIEFTNRRTDPFPFQVDPNITPNIEIKKVIAVYGEPDVTGSGFNIGDTQLGGWVKWKTKSYQLHCEVIDSKVVMVTMMKPDWEPGN